MGHTQTEEVQTAMQAVHQHDCLQCYCSLHDSWFRYGQAEARVVSGGGAASEGSIGHWHGPERACAISEACM